jgi:hypothetical protein
MKLISGMAKALVSSAYISRDHSMLSMRNPCLQVGFGQRGLRYRGRDKRVEDLANTGADLLGESRGDVVDEGF